MQVEIKKDFKELIPRYMELLNEDILKIEIYIQNSNFDNLILEFHKLKGHGQTYGFEYISNLASAMEHFSEKKNLELVEKSFNQLKKFIANMEIVFI